MLEIREFRPWKIVSPEAALGEILSVERKSDDRSQFVRYARASATWAHWVREGLVAQEVPASSPRFGGYQYQVVPIESLIPTQSVLPKDKEDRQRLLEATQLYFDPIVVDSQYRVLGGHDLYAAAVGLQADMARPGKVRASDYCLIAIDESPNLQFNALKFKAAEFLIEELNNLTGSSANTFQVFVPELAEPIEIPLTSENLNHFRRIIGARTLDLNSRYPENEPVIDAGFVKVLFPFPPTPDIKVPFDSFALSKVPQSGAIMWSLTDFIRS